jgi:5-methylthioadenosine/S-adenosylhomocysteine deaminase
MSNGQFAAGDRADRVTLIHARHVVPVRPANTLYQDYSVALRDDRVLDLLPRAEAAARWPDAPSVELPHHVLLPGLVNSHTHSPMTLLRGYADGHVLLSRNSRRSLP